MGCRCIAIPVAAGVISSTGNPGRNASAARCRRPHENLDASVAITDRKDRVRDQGQNHLSQLECVAIDDGRRRAPPAARYIDTDPAMPMARPYHCGMSDSHHAPHRPQRPPEQSAGGTQWRARLHTIVFEADTPAGRAFDLGLIALIALSVMLVSMETVNGLSPATYRAMRAAEWALTGLFTIEYMLRLLAVRHPIVYAASFYGMIDLIAILPTWVSLFVPGAQVLLVVRVLRLLRIFRVLKLTRYLSEARIIGDALRASSQKISVFLLAVAAMVVVFGTVMYVVEGPAHGFTSIPRSMYWAVVTLTTVGYGDISPKTPLGQTLASLVMILGYGVIAVPTGIVTAELTQSRRTPVPESTQACEACGLDHHDVDARFCRRCGAAL